MIDFDNPPKCGYCGEPMESYDPDRGFSCSRSKCPRNIAMNKRQERYNESRRLHEELVPLLKDVSASEFTVGELLAIIDQYGDGFVVQKAAKRLRKVSR